MRSYRILALFVLGLLLFCVGCSSAIEQTGIVGTWDMTKFSNVYVFLEDGTGTVSTADDTVVIPFTYEWTGSDMITIDYDKRGAESLEAKVSMPGTNTLVLESSQPQTTLTMTRR